MYWALFITGYAVISYYYVRTLLSMEGTYNLVHVTFRITHEETDENPAIPQENTYNNDILCLRSFNEDILDQMIEDKKIDVSNSTSTIKGETHKEFAIRYLEAFCRVLKKKGNIDFEKHSNVENFERYVEGLMSQNFKSNLMHFTETFVKKYSNIHGLIQDDNDFEFRVGITKIMLLTYIDILKKHRTFAKAIIDDRSDAILSSFRDEFVSYPVNRINSYFESCDIDLRRHLGDQITNLQTNNPIQNSKEKINHYYVDITAIFVDIIHMFKLNVAETKFYLQYESIEASLIKSVKQALCAIMMSKKPLSDNQKQKYTIMFDPYSLVEFLKFQFPMPTRRIGSLIDNMDKLYEKIRFKLVNLSEEIGSVDKVEFLAKKDILKSKVNSHAITKEITDKLALPEFQDIAKILYKIFGPNERKGLFTTKNNSFADSLVDNILDRDLMDSLDDCKYRIAKKIIAKGCVNCKGKDILCLKSQKFGLEFDYIYTQIVSYCMPLKCSIGYVHFQNMAELIQFYSKNKKAAYSIYDGKPYVDSKTIVKTAMWHYQAGGASKRINKKTK